MDGPVLFVATLLSAVAVGAVGDGTVEVFARLEGGGSA